MSTTTVTCTKQMMASSNTGDANPGDLHIPIGRWTSLAWNGRATLYAPINFSGMTAINAAYIFLRFHVPASGWHAKGTSQTTIQCYRKTADWSETSHGGSAAIDELWGANGAAVVNNNIVYDGDQTNVSLGADNAWASLNLTETVRQWFNGQPNYGFLLYDVNETNSSYAKEFWSRHQSGSQPYIYIDYSTNTAPNAPTNLSPTGNTVVHNGTVFNATGNNSDPDAGDYLTGVQVLCYTSTNTLVADTGYLGASGTYFSVGINVGGYGANRQYYWKARTWDKAGVVGPYSAAQYVTLNSAPNVPSINGVATDDLTPNLSGSCSDPDSANGGSVVGVQLSVTRASDGATMWDSGELANSGTSFSKTYSGSALSWGVQYRYQARVKDNLGAWSGWSGFVYWTTSQPTGPTQSPRTTTPGVAWGGKINDTTPDLTLTYASQFKNHEIFVYSNVGGTTQVFTDAPGVDYALTTSKVVTCSTTLTNGATYYWKARVKLNDGTWTAWAGFASGQSGNLSSAFYINALPTAATGIYARDRVDSPLTTRPTDGLMIVTSLVPALEAVFTDADISVYSDVPSARSIEIYNDSTGALVHSNENLTPGYGIPMRYFPGTAAGANTTLAAAASAGATNIKVTSVTSMAIGDWLRIGPDGGTQEVRKIVTVGTAGSGGTGITLDGGLAYAHANAEAVVELTAVLSNETTYKMRWRFQDNSDTYGTWSNYVQFKVTQPSTVSTLTPSGTVTSPSFTASWNHSSPGGKAQGQYRLKINRDSDLVDVYDTGPVTSATESHVVPGGTLQNGTNYTVSVEVYDSDGV